MWLFTNRGFFSVVQHNDYPDMVIVRARAEQDIREFRAIAKGLCGVDVEHSVTPLNDYRFRVVVGKSVFKHVAAYLADNINYGNFKAEIKDDRRHHAYMDVWLAMIRFQKDCIKKMKINTRRKIREMGPCPVCKSNHVNAERAIHHFATATAEQLFCRCYTCDHQWLKEADS